MDQTAELKQTIRQAAEEAVLNLENRVSQTYNDVWPWVIVIGAVSIVFLLGIVSIILYWINRKSYMVQKPVYEQIRNAAPPRN